MRLLSLLLSLLHGTALVITLPGYSNSTTRPLFSPPPISTSSALPFLHTSLSSLLPILPNLSRPPSHTLLVTLATPAFKPLLYNWLCFLRYRARWGEPASHTEHGEPAREKTEEEKTGWEDVPKLLVITSDERLARELSEEGVVVWWLRGVDWDAVEQAEDEGDQDALAELDRQLQDDLFTNLRLLDLLLPPKPSSALSERLTDSMLPWGTLHYQSLMLERTLAMSALVAALVESQKSDPRWRKEMDDDWRRRILEHDWENEELLELPEYVGVKGVLLVDNDAVWLSSPTPFLSHYYRPTASHPSIIFAPDMAPSTRNAWGTHEMPCACFLYSRVSDHAAQLASHPSSSIPQPEQVNPYLYSPAEGSVEAWRATALCHISMIMQAVETGKKQAANAKWRRAAEDAGGRRSKNPQLSLHKPTTGDSSASSEGGQGIGLLKIATAPSFQATSLGPALFLSEQHEAHLPEIDYQHWLAALGSGDVDDLLFLLEDSGLSLTSPSSGQTCLSLAQTYQSTCPAPPRPLSTLDLLASLVTPSSPSVPPPVRPHRPIRTEALPFDLFPPGMRFFDGGLEPGARPCVVHANYATGQSKERLLRERGLWALVEPEGEEEDGRKGAGEGEGWKCHAGVMERA
ncbi:hypothetical protein JCM11641_002804 [Rhodosporidiobolus odoratus]